MIALHPDHTGLQTLCVPVLRLPSVNFERQRFVVNLLDLIDWCPGE
jgi:hypothetical protein